MTFIAAVSCHGRIEAILASYRSSANAASASQKKNGAYPLMTFNMVGLLDGSIGSGSGLCRERGGDGADCLDEQPDQLREERFHGGAAQRRATAGAASRSISATPSEDLSDPAIVRNIGSGSWRVVSLNFTITVRAAGFT